MIPTRILGSACPLLIAVVGIRGLPTLPGRNDRAQEWQSSQRTDSFGGVPHYRRILAIGNAGPVGPTEGGQLISFATDGARSPEAAAATGCLNL